MASGRSAPTRRCRPVACHRTTCRPSSRAAEARRLVNVDRGSLEEIRDDQLAKLDMIIVSAIAKKELRTAVQAIEAASRIAGLALCPLR